MAVFVLQRSAMFGIKIGEPVEPLPPTPIPTTTEFSALLASTLSPGNFSALSIDWIGVVVDRTNTTPCVDYEERRQGEKRLIALERQKPATPLAACIASGAASQSTQYLTPWVRCVASRGVNPRCHRLNTLGYYCPNLQMKARAMRSGHVQVCKQRTTHMMCYREVFSGICDFRHIIQEFSWQTT